MEENQSIKLDTIRLVSRNEFEFQMPDMRKASINNKIPFDNPSIGLRSLDKLSSSTTNKTSPSVMKMYNLRELGKIFD